MHRPAIASRHVQPFAMPAIVVAILAAACSAASPSASVTGVVAASTSPSLVPTASPSPMISPRPSPTALPSQPASPPTGWLSCTNAHAGFEIGYPAAWHTAALNPQQACQQFDPLAFEIPVDSEYPLTALYAVQTQDPFDPETSGAADPFARTLVREDTTVGGRRAVRFEQSIVEAGSYPAGTTSYGYVIDRDGREFRVFTVAVPESSGDYETWKTIVDQAVGTVRFLGS